MIIGFSCCILAQIQKCIIATGGVGRALHRRGYGDGCRIAEKDAGVGVLSAGGVGCLIR